MFIGFKMAVGVLVYGFILDGLVGDPRWMPHPVRWMGRYISGGEKVLRKILPDSRWGQVIGGMILTISLVILSIGLPLLCLWAFDFLEPIIYERTGWIVETSAFVSIFMCWQIIACKDLKVETMAVYKKLVSGDLQNARVCLSRVVGRDTKNLSEEAVCRATVETIAENASDGVIAPMFYFLIGGAPLAFAYKAVNTLDSMIGYKNEKYIFFGRYAAILDDIANFIPARITGILMVIGSFFLNYDASGAFRIMKRDRKNHTSPNAGVPEAACAGALGVRLGGASTYNGRVVEKPFIGDERTKITRNHIIAANKLMTMSACVFIAFGLFVNYILRF